MKKIYLVKKDPLMPSSEDNWIYMNQYQFCRFIETPEGKSRIENFAQLDGVDEDDIIYIIECNKKVANQLRKEKNRSDYLRSIEKEENIIHISLDASSDSEANDKNGLSNHEKLFVSNEDMFWATVKKIAIEKLRKTFASLSNEELWMLQKLYLDENPCSLLELSRKLNIPYMTLYNRLKKILEKIKKNIGEF